MKKVSVQAFIKEINAIYNEKPTYETGHDGSDGRCDCIGMVRGALKRSGSTDLNGLHGTNQAARKAINKLAIIDYVKNLRLGDVVLKTRSKDDADMPLPDRYRKGGADYDETVGETNFTHIGTITCTNPFEITHMTSPTAKKDKSIKGWTYYGELKAVEYDPEPGPEPKPDTAVVFAPTGSTVNMRKAPSINAALVERVPIGETVIVIEYGEEWCNVKWKWFTGYMMTKFLIFDGETSLYKVTVHGLTFDQAESLMMDYPNATIEKERG